jgi:hypothetical protein
MSNTVSTQPVKKRKFRLLAGFHNEQTGYDQHGVPITRTYAPGDIVESNEDLAMMFNTRASTKFGRVYKEAEEEEESNRREAQETDNLESLTLKQLQALAEDEALAIEGDPRSKADFIAGIRKARQGA